MMYLERLKEPDRRRTVTQGATGLWTTAQAARFLGIKPRTLQHWVRVNYVPHLRLGPKTARAIRFCPGTLAEWTSSLDPIANLPQKK
jgi:hypothetical protein